MTGEPEPPESAENPLAGVLDRLLQREHGQPAAPPTSTRGLPSDDARPVEETVTRARRMVTVAEPGVDQGSAALRSAAQWATVLGRRPSITDLACGEPGAIDSTGVERTPAGEGRVPRARVPCEPERIRHEPAEIALALLERLRRHESESDLVIVRIPAHERLVLMRAAFLSGAVVIPVGEADLHEALDITREVLESFLEVSVWPFSPSARNMERYLALCREHDDGRIVPFDPGQQDLAAAIDGLREPPREGFLVGLLAPEPATLSAELLHIDSMAL